MSWDNLAAIEPDNRLGVLPEELDVARSPAVGALLVTLLRLDKVVLHLWLPVDAGLILIPLVNAPVKPITVQDTV